MFIFNICQTIGGVLLSLRWESVESFLSTSINLKMVKMLLQDLVVQKKTTSESFDLISSVNTSCVTVPTGFRTCQVRESGNQKMRE
ncbi:hypothetical protein CDAR_46451 [Caerostris darwini]|uniref:Uncharacterized protein n=1 Tax=Caerostris darwini TaxID=1538125 RepID=A0AAV4S1A3_9ARAC|nr:hypothetical protein CDAR_46451 [Caerostris darwini]